MSTSFLQDEHLKPQSIICSGCMKFSKHWLKETTPLDDLLAFLGISTLKSMNWSKHKSWKPQLRQVVRLISCPSNRSVIIELSLSLKYWLHSLLYYSIGRLGKFNSLYAGFFVTLFSSSCMRSSRKRMNS